MRPGPKPLGCALGFVAALLTSSLCLKRAAALEPETVFFCTEDYAGPALLGWCSDGRFFGPVHLGSLGVVAATDEEFFGMVQLALASRAGDDFFGLLQAGVVAYGNKSLMGVQAGAVTVVERYFAGIQLGGVNVLGDDSWGLQLGGFNYAVAETVGGQLSLVNMAEAIYGVQLGVLNLLEEDYDDEYGSIEGAQLGALNIAFQVNGLQVGWANLARRESAGGQIGVMSAAEGKLSGFQLGPFNYAEHLEGTQIGAVNYAERVEGVQIGVINMADQLEGLQIGVLNIWPNGTVPFLPILNADW